MERARLESDWNRTSVIACQIANVLCTERSQLRRPEHFHPFAAAGKKAADGKRNLPRIKASELASMLGNLGS